MASLNNMSTVYANEIYKIFSTGVSEISDTYATKTELNDINNTAEVTANADAIAVFKYKTITKFQRY